MAKIKKAVYARRRDMKANLAVAAAALVGAFALPIPSQATPLAAAGRATVTENISAKATEKVRHRRYGYRRYGYRRYGYRPYYYRRYSYRPYYGYGYRYPYYRPYYGGYGYGYPYYGAYYGYGYGYPYRFYRRPSIYFGFGF
jgi:hypothetical protein